MKRRLAANLHRLSLHEVQVARDGDYTDGCGLILRVKNGSAVWVLDLPRPADRVAYGALVRRDNSSIGVSLQPVAPAQARAFGLVRPPLPAARDSMRCISKPMAVPNNRLRRVRSRIIGIIGQVTCSPKRTYSRNSL